MERFATAVLGTLSSTLVAGRSRSSSQISGSVFGAVVTARRVVAWSPLAIEAPGCPTRRACRRPRSAKPDWFGSASLRHATLPFGAPVKVEKPRQRTNLDRADKRSRAVNKGRIIAVSRAAAEELGFVDAGLARARLTIVDGAGPLDGSCAESPAGQALPLPAIPAKDGEREVADMASPDLISW